MHQVHAQSAEVYALQGRGVASAHQRPGSLSRHCAKALPATLGSFISQGKYRCCTAQEAQQAVAGKVSGTTASDLGLG